jgi:DNA-binding GntR family transcriptional regulator
VYRKLHELIVRGHLAPGTRITETDVTHRLGVSRTPVRAALQKLQHEGYIVVSHNGHRSRPVVAPLTREDAADLLNVIGAIEGLAAWYAAQMPRTPRARLVSDLRQTNRALKAAAQALSPDSGLLYDLDHAFHQCYVDAAAGPRLLQLHQGIKPQAERYNRLYTSALMDQILTSVTEHDAIIRAIGRGRADEAREAVETNWRNAGARFRQAIERVGERGRW